jgi:hypothetical protein
LLYDRKADEGQELSSEAVLASGEKRRACILEAERKYKAKEKK